MAVGKRAPTIGSENAVGLIVAGRHGEHGIAIDIVPVIRQGDYDLIGSSNVGRQLLNLRGQLLNLRGQLLNVSR